MIETVQAICSWTNLPVDQFVRQQTSVSATNPFGVDANDAKMVK